MWTGLGFHPCQIEEVFSSFMCPLVENVQLSDRLIQPLIIIFEAGEECFWVVYRNTSGVHLILNTLKAFWLLFCIWEDDQRRMERERTFTLVAICTEDCIEVDHVNSGFDPLAFPFISRAVAIWNWSTQSSSFQFWVYVFTFQLSLNRNDYGCFAIANCCQYEQPLKLGHDIMTYSGFSSQTWIWVCVVRTFLMLKLISDKK